MLTAVLYNQSNMNGRLIVIGSNSFSGSHLIDYALKNNNKVIGISRSGEIHEVFRPYGTRPGTDYKFYSLDLNHHLTDILELVDTFKPEYIFNFAAQGMVEESWKNPEHWYRTNFISAVELHNALLKRKFLKRFIQVSTPEVYGNSSGNLTEDNCCKPSTPYAVSKAACDLSLLAYNKKYGFPVLITRAANVYGPGQQLFRVIPKTILNIKEHRKVPLHGGGRVRRSFIHIEDVVRATYELAEKGVPGEIYHIASQNLISIRELVERICSRLDVDFESYVEQSNERDRQDNEYRLDSGKLGNLTGWKDAIDLDTGLDQVIDWINRNYEVLAKMPREYIHKE